MKKFLKLEWLESGENLALFALRAFVGVFLMWETWDNVKSAERMTEFVGFMTANGFPAAGFLAPLSVWAQFICGALLIIGLLTRPAALIMAFNFVVAFLMVHLSDSLRGQFPALILIFVSIYLATRGGGKIALDRFWAKDRG